MTDRFTPPEHYGFEGGEVFWKFWHIVYKDPEMDRALRLDGKPLAIVDADTAAEALRLYRADQRNKLTTAGFEVRAIPA